MARRGVVWLIVCAFMVLNPILGAAAAAAADLRIETRVYAAGEDKPLSQSVTFFHKGVVYDFRTGASRVTVFRAGAGEKPGRFLLLDTDSEQRTDIPMDQVSATMSKLRRWASMQSDAFLRFSSAPSFDEQFDSDTGELLLTSESLSYRLKTTPLKHPELGSGLKAFLDGFAQLHALVEAGPPPGPRLKVNEALFQHGVIPLSVELTAQGEDEPGIRAEHEVTWVLSKADLARIDSVADQLASFHKVSNAEFHEKQRQLAGSSE